MEPDGPTIRAQKSDEGLSLRLPDINLTEFSFSVRCPEAAPGTVQLLVIDDARVSRQVGPLSGPQ